MTLDLTTSGSDEDVSSFWTFLSPLGLPVLSDLSSFWTFLDPLGLPVLSDRSSVVFLFPSMLNLNWENKDRSSSSLALLAAGCCLVMDDFCVVCERLKSVPMDTGLLDESALCSVLPSNMFFKSFRFVGWFRPLVVVCLGRSFSREVHVDNPVGFKCTPNLSILTMIITMNFHPMMITWWKKNHKWVMTDIRKKHPSCQCWTI